MKNKNNNFPINSPYNNLNNNNSTWLYRWWVKKKYKYKDPNKIPNHIPSDKELKKYKWRKRKNIFYWFFGLSPFVVLFILYITSLIY